MTDTTGALPPAGWYPDPYGAPIERWWDGQQWTEHTNTPAAAAPVTPVPAAPVQPEPAPYVPPLEEPYVAPTPADPFAGFVTPSHAPTEPTGDPYAYQAPEPEPEAYQPYQAQPYQAPEPEAYQPYQAPEPEAYQPYQAPEPQPYQPYQAPEPAPFEPAAYEPPVEAPHTYQPYTPPAQGYDSTAAAPAAAQPNPASSFDFGFGALIAGENATGESAQAGNADSGLFGSWAPTEYVEPPRNGAASAGLVLGILSFFLSALAGIPGLILSAVGIGRASRLGRDGDGPVGRGKGVAGVALSIIGTAASAALILYGLQWYNAQQTADDPGSDPDTSEEADLTQNGGIPLEIGAIGTILLPDSETAAIQFSVASITPNFTCTAEGAVSPTNGQYVAVAINFTTHADYLTAMDGSTPLRMSQSDWIGFLADENGTQVVNTDSGNSCISAAEQLPTDIPAGENVSGTVVLDMSADVASISWSPTGVANLDPGIIRWEWFMPAP